MLLPQWHKQVIARETGAESSKQNAVPNTPSSLASTVLDILHGNAKHLNHGYFKYWTLNKLVLITLGCKRNRYFQTLTCRVLNITFFFFLVKSHRLSSFHTTVMLYCEPRCGLKVIIFIIKIYNVFPLKDIQNQRATSQTKKKVTISYFGSVYTECTTFSKNTSSSVSQKIFSYYWETSSESLT